MPHLWKQDRSPSGAPQWVADPLDGDEPVLLGAASAGGGALLMRSRSDHQGETWLAMNTAAGIVVVNGTPILAGIRVLCDRDEIRVDGDRVFFSTERLARIEPFPGAKAPVFCPRCKQEIVGGSPAVQCPACRRYYHESTESPCWSYAPQCLCGQPTALDAGFQWTPDGL